VKQKVRQTARYIALSALGSLSVRPQGAFLRPLYFHEVGAHDAQNFCEILKRLRREGDFVNTETCLAMLKGSRPIAGRFFHLSFDDGHRSLFEQAIPVLNQMQIPALFFVCSSRVGVDSNLLTWEDLRKMQSWGFEIGSHTRTHANLIEAARTGTLEEELAGSKREIERRLRTACPYFAWPFGRKQDINKASLQAVVEAGYQASFGAFRGSIHAGVTDAFQIPRHHLEASWPWRHVRFFAYGHGE
jgi:peptidoglycan/xylan/chitin deacetylase (PgdA/CDA1 family)